MANSSRSDYDIDNDTGANFRTELNTLLGIIKSTNSSGDVPPGPNVVGQLWYDSTNAVLKVCSIPGDPGTFVVIDATNAATATELATGRTISTTGDVTVTTGAFNGSGNVTGVANISPGVVGNTELTGDGTISSSKLTGDLPAISGANLTNLPAGGNTITISQGTTTFSYSNPSGFRVNTVTLNARSFFPRVDSNNFGTDGNPGGQPNITGRTIGGGSTIPGGVGSNYTIPFNVSLDFRTDHGRGGATRVSWEYLTFS